MLDKEFIPIKTLITCSIFIIISNAQQCVQNCSLRCIPKSPCHETKSTSLRILFDTGRNINIFCKEFKTYSADIFPVFGIHPNGLNLSAMINKCYKSRLKHIKYNFEFLSRDPINITTDTFAESTNVEILKLVSWNENIYFGFKENFLKNLTNLKQLTLERIIRDKPSFLFQDINGLTNLKIAHNQIEEIPENAFQYLANLTFLEFYENGVKSMKSKAFNGLKNLHFLDLSRNFLEDLSANVFSELTDLRHFDLYRNNIKHIHAKTFSQTQKLEFLDLSSNKNLTINDTLFTHLSNLKYLNLSFCGITEITKDMFKGAKNLEQIRLGYNRITKIDSNSFKKLISLQYLNISGNHLLTFDFEIYENIKTLKVLDVAFNKIKTIKKVPTNAELEQINLRGNVIDSIPELSAGNGSLKSLDIGYNILKGLLKLKRDYPKSGTFDLGLVRNKFDKLEWSEPDHDISMNMGTTSVNVQENHLSCDCEKHVITTCFNYPICRESSWMKIEINREKIDCFWHVYPDDAPYYPVSCPIINVYYTPKDCEVYFKENKEEHLEPSFVLDCSFKNLTSLPELKNFKFGDTTFSKEINLLLNGNKLRSFLKKDMDIGYQHITHLNLSNNFIEKFDWIPKNVKVVDLSRNRLTNLGDKVLKHFEVTKSLNKIILNKNPWKCDCDSQHLKEYLINNANLKVIKSDVYCESTGTDLVVSQICGENNLKIILPATVAVAFAIISALMALYFHYRTPIKVWLYSKNLLMWWVAHEDFDKDKKYDVFISYSYKDEDFVRAYLLPEMEKPECPFKVCIHYRDFIPGEFISKQITNAVLDSRRTVVVLSNNFMESVWGKMEFRMAHTQAISENKIRVIVVIYGELDENNLDEDMKAYLKTNTYVKWGDPWFWNKLRYALPHSNRLREQTEHGDSFICCSWFYRATHVFSNNTENINMTPLPEN